MITTKRIYEPPSGEDGFRILVDRLWPRGVSKEDAELDLWLKEVAPTIELRTWFGHEPERFEEFSARYRAELEANPAFERLLDMARERESITLLYAARDLKRNHAAVLCEFARDALA